MNEKDKAVWYAAVDEWMTSSAGQDLGKFMFEKALAHRDEQIKGLGEALEQFCSLIQHQYTGSQEAMSALQNADNKAQAALASYKEQTK